MSKSRLEPLARAVLHTQTDERLVALARRGKERAFDEIVRRYRPGLVAFAAAYRPPDPEDVVQESLVRAWTALRDSTGDMHLKAWLYTIVRNRALNARRDTRVHEELPAEIDGVRQPSEIVLTNEELDRVVGVVAALPDAQREALVRSALEGHTHEQIAASLGSTEGAVRQLIYRARVAVRHGVGFVLPLPLVALLIEAGAGAAGGAAAGAAGGAAVAGGGASLATKIAAVAAIGAVAIGSGVAIERSRDSRGDERQSNQTRQVRDSRTNQPAAAQVSSSSGSEGTGEDSGSGTSGSSRGPGGGDDDRGEGSDDSGPSSGEGPDDSGPSGSSGSGSDDDSSGSGSAGTAVDDDSSGSGSANSGHGSESSGPGSTSSGSGSGGSGSSGSGSSGSGSGSSGGDSSGPGSGSESPEIEIEAAEEDNSGSGGGDGFEVDNSGSGSAEDPPEPGDD